jgi:hypothetical protein
MRNGRRDDSYQKWRWQPTDCDLPRYVLASSSVSLLLLGIPARRPEIIVSFDRFLHLHMRGQVE